MGIPRIRRMGIPHVTNMQNLCLLACIVCASMMQAHAGGPLTISFSSGDSTIGVYYIGNETALSAGDISAQKVDMEILAGVLGPNKQMMHTSYFDHAFVVRSSNMHFRAKVAVYKNTDEAQKYPYTIQFKNLMLEDPPQHMELKHSTSGYIWVPPGQRISHRTDVNHDFTLRDMDRKPVLTVRLNRSPERDDF